MVRLSFCDMCRSFIDKIAKLSESKHKPDILEPPQYGDNRAVQAG